MTQDEPPDPQSDEGHRRTDNPSLDPAVLVLAGGVSNRLWPLRDKLLLDFGGMSLLERHLRQLQAEGCRSFIVVSRPETRDAVEAVGERIGVRIQVVEQAEALGMADAVLRAGPLLASLDHPPLYITQAHDVVDQSLHAQLLRRAQSTPCDGLIAAARVDSYFPGGYLTLDGERIASVVEKPGAGNEPSDLVNLVAHYFRSSRALLATLEAESNTPGEDDAYERALSRLMRDGDFRPVVYEGRWQGLKYPWHVLEVMDLLLERWTSGAELPAEGYEQREDGVFLAKDVRVYPGAYLVGPALVGPGSVIGHNALVRGSVIGPRCVVGFGSEVARSYLAEGVELHHNYVGDSVFDHHSAMGYGAVTANYRIDGRTVPMHVGNERIDTGRMKLGLVLGAGSHLGVNVSTMPGVKIGAGVLIGSNLRIARDVPDEERVLNDGEYGRL